MTSETDTASSVEQNEVRQLLESRSIVQGWLAKLDTQKGEVSERVLSRVREDYENRLQDVLDALSRHRQALQEELDRATGRLADAERAFVDAKDEWEETRLRHVIGEIDETAWAERSRSLEEASRTAESHEEALRAETSRLRELLGQLDERTVDAPSAPDVEDVEVGTPPEEEFNAVAIGTSATEKPLFSTDEEALADDAAAEDDYDLENATFLQRIDRAITDLPTASSGEEEESEEDTAPKPGLKCPECGYTNDLSAWFCGVCGADVG